MPYSKTLTKAMPLTTRHLIKCVPASAFVERVAEDLNDTTLRPPALLGLPRRDTLDREMPVNGIRTHLLLHTPAIDLPDHLGFRLVDHEVLWRGGRLVNVEQFLGNLRRKDFVPIRGSSHDVRCHLCAFL